MTLLRASRRVISRAAALAFVLLAIGLAIGLAAARPAHAAATLTLDNDATGPLVTAAALAPGQQPPQCVQVSYQSASSGDQIGLFAALTTGGTGLENYLQVTIAAGSGGVYGDCSGFVGATIFNGTLATFASTYGSSSSALASASLGAGSGSVSYEFTFTLADDNAAQGKTADAWFTWLAEPATSPLPSPSTSPTVSPSPMPSTAPRSSAPTSNPSDKGAPSASETAAPSASPPMGASPRASSTGTTPAVQPIAPASGSPSSTPAPTTPATSSGSPSPDPSAKHGNETTVPMFGSGNPPSNSSFLDDVKQVIGKFVHEVVHDATPAAKGTAFSLIFLVLVVLFLLVQSRIDRRDPKLANAPLLPNFLQFDPPTPGGNNDVA